MNRILSVQNKVIPIINDGEYHWKIAKALIEDGFSIYTEKDTTDQISNSWQEVKDVLNLRANEIDQFVVERIENCLQKYGGCGGVICDYQLGDMHIGYGMDIVKKVRAQVPVKEDMKNFFKEIPIIGCSIPADYYIKEEFMKAGADEFFHMSEIATHICKVLKELISQRRDQNII